MATAKGEIKSMDLGGGVTTTAMTTSESRFAAWPGATLLYPIGNFFVGGDARFLIVSEMNAFSLFATAGLQF